MGKAWENFLKSFGIDPEKMFEKEMTEANGYSRRKPWKDLLPKEKVGLLDYFLRSVFADKYGLQVSGWSPRCTIDELMYELSQNGPLFVAGKFGKAAYVAPPFALRQKIDDRSIYGWNPGSSRNAHDFTAHTILIIGAKKADGNSYVYFIDADDQRDPAKPSNEKIYVISYNNLRNNICDLHGRLQTNSPQNIGYAYHGNFKLKQKDADVPVCSITQMPLQFPRILLEDGFTYEKYAIEKWLEKNRSSPMMGTKLESATLLPNYALTRPFICLTAGKPIS